MLLYTWVGGIARRRVQNTLPRAENAANIEFSLSPVTVWLQGQAALNIPVSSLAWSQTYITLLWSVCF